MASGGTICPCCDRAVCYTSERKLFVHMPYEHKRDADLLDRGGVASGPVRPGRGEKGSGRPYTPSREWLMGEGKR